MEGSYWCHCCLRSVHCTEQALCSNCGFGGIEKLVRPVIELPESMRHLPPDQISDRLRFLFDMLNEVSLAEEDESMPEEEIDMLPAVMRLQDSCAVCLQERGEDVARQLPCGHTFHDLCLRNWLKLKATCPICKQSARDLDSCDDFEF